MHFRFSWFGILLVVVGAVLFLHRMGFIPFEWHLVFWGIIALAGAGKIYQGFLTKRARAVFWGTLLFAFGTLNVLDGLDVYSVSDPSIVAAIFLSLGLAFFLSYLVNSKGWHILVPAVIFLALGGVTLLANLGYLYRWDVEEFVHTYWPAALIIFGGSLLLSRAPTQ